MSIQYHGILALAYLIGRLGLRSASHHLAFGTPPAIMYLRIYAR